MLRGGFLTTGGSYYGEGVILGCFPPNISLAMILLVHARVLSTLRANIKEVRKFGVKRMELFGSYVR